MEGRASVECSTPSSARIALVRVMRSMRVWHVFKGSCISGCWLSWWTILLDIYEKSPSQAVKLVNKQRKNILSYEPGLFPAQTFKASITIVETMLAI